MLKKKEDTFHDIVIYNHTDKASEQFFSSQTGQLRQHHDITSLLLNEGYGYTYSEGNSNRPNTKLWRSLTVHKREGLNLKILQYIGVILKMTLNS